jgi:hypothetical protein
VAESGVAAQPPRRENTESDNQDEQQELLHNW